MLNPKLTLKQLQQEEVICLDLEKSNFVKIKNKLKKSNLKGFAFIDINYLKKLIDFVEKKSSSRVVAINHTIVFAKHDSKTKHLSIAYFNNNKICYAVLAGYRAEFGKEDLELVGR